jgi:hypothetical protein
LNGFGKREPKRIDKSSKHKSTFLLWWAMASLLIASPAWPATQVDLTTAVQGELRPTIEGSCNLRWRAEIEEARAQVEGKASLCSLGRSHDCGDRMPLFQSPLDK